MADHDNAPGPDPVDITKPNAARAYDFLLGGSHNFKPDRQFARTVRDSYPGAVPLAQANRQFLRHAVRHCLSTGITQLLDLGTGPADRRQRPRGRLVAEPERPHRLRRRRTRRGHTYSRQLLGVSDQVTVTQADLRDPATVLTSPGVAGLLDFTRPRAACWSWPSPAPTTPSTHGEPVYSAEHVCLTEGRFRPPADGIWGGRTCGLAWPDSPGAW